MPSPEDSRGTALPFRARLPSPAEAVERIGERSPPDVGALLAERWLAVLLVAATASQALATWRIVRRLSPGTRPGLRDSIIFEYVGWRLARGDRLYVDLWEVKPPLAYELPAVLALLSPDVVVYHWLSVLLTNAAAVGIVLLVGALVVEVTDDGLAAIAGGLAVYAHPAFAWRAPIGFKAKYVVVAFGLVCVYLALRERPGLSGLAGGAALVVWQLGPAFPAIGAALAYGRAGRSGAVRFAAGAAGAGLLVLLPVAHWGALDAMIVEVVFTPLLAGPQRPLPGRVEYAVRLLDLAIPVAVLGLYGLAVSLRERWRADGWWIPAGAAWFGLAIVGVDFDGPPDLVPFLAFVALGIGIVVAERRDPAVVWLVLCMAAVSVLTVGEFGYFGRLPIPQAYAVPGEMFVSPPYDAAERRYLFWRARPPGTCRTFLGVTQLRLVRAIGGSVEQATCGHWGPAWEALVAKYPVLRALGG